jgi:hypothetical protein
MHYVHDDRRMPTPDDRRREVARILAGAVLRLRARAALPAPELTAPRILTENVVNPLDVPAETRLSVSSS